MKHPEDAWEPHPPFGPHPQFEDEDQQQDSPAFSAIRQIELLGRLHHMAFGSILQEDGLPPAQAGAIRVIIRHPGLSQRELADKLHIQRATATVMLQKMERAGYIDRRPDRDDQRISRIYPTDMALAMDTENQKAVNDYFVRCFQGIRQEDFDVMLRSLSRLGDNLHAILREHPDSQKE